MYTNDRLCRAIGYVSNLNCTFSHQLTEPMLIPDGWYFSNSFWHEVNENILSKIKSCPDVIVGSFEEINVFNIVILGKSFGT